MRRSDVQELIKNYSRRLQKRRNQEALQGINTPPEVLVEIEDIEAKLAALQQELEALDGGDDLDRDDQALIRAEIEKELAALKQPAQPPPAGGVSIGEMSGGNLVTAPVSGDVVAGDKYTTITEVFDQQSPLVRVLAIGGIGLSLLLVLVLILSETGALASLRAQGGPFASLWPLPVPTPTPVPPLPDGFNIGIATLTTGDESIAGEEARTMSDWLFSTVERAVQTDFPPEMAVNLRSPALIGPVSDDNAAGEAAEHKLSVLVYGRLDRDRTGVYLQPAFFVPDHNERFDYAREIGGINRFGAAIPLELPFNEASLTGGNRVLLSRVRALNHVLLGLGNFFFKRHVEANEDFRRALETGDWSNTDGAEVVHLLQGAARLRMTDQSLPGTDAWNSAIVEARQSFSQALSLNPEYARAYLGLGTTALNQAKSFERPGVIASVDERKLEEAAGWYRQAFEASEQPPLAYVPQKAAYQLGRTYQLGYEFLGPAWPPDQALTYYGQVIAAFDPDATPELNWLVGNAYVSACELEALVAAQPGATAPDWPAVEEKCRRGLTILEEMPHGNALSPLPEYRAILAYTVMQQPDRQMEGCRLYERAVAEAAALGQRETWIEEIRRAMAALGCE